MTYLDLARSNQTKTKETKTGGEVGPERQDESATGYERNELNEKSPAPTAPRPGEDATRERRMLRETILEAAAWVGPDFDAEHYATLWRRDHVVSGCSPVTAARILAHLAAFTPQQVEQIRQEVADAADDDPYVAIDRAALSRFDTQINHVLGATA